MTPFLLAQVVQLNCTQVIEQYSTDGLNQGYPRIQELLLDFSTRQGMLTEHSYDRTLKGYRTGNEQTNSLMITKNHVIWPSRGPYMFTINRRSLKAGYTRPTNIKESDFRYQCKLN